ncbi:MAG: polysaccharide deacetylase family protein [Sulfolobales archaeon]|nr:polysaccharide deacetylase family protein [Sulfolobales archaeon]
MPFLDKLRILDLAIRLKPSNLAIIVYHNVSFNRSCNQTFEEPFPAALIEKQIISLIQNGYTVTSLRDALNLLNKGVNKKIAVLTFDDGYRGVYESAYPILKKYHIKATLYVTAGFIKFKTAPWWEQLYYIFNKAKHVGKTAELNQLISQMEGKQPIQNTRDVSIFQRSLITKIVRVMDVSELKSMIYMFSKKLGINIPEDLYHTTMLSLDEVKELAEYGFEIGGHGLWHVNLTNLSRKRLMEEVEMSLDFVKTLCEDTYTFAYPFGLYNGVVIKAVVHKGFKAAVTLDPRTNRLPLTNVYVLGRVPPYKFGLKDIASLKYSLVRG